MIAPTEGSVVLNLSGEVEGRIVTNKQGVMTVETDVVEESSSGGETLTGGGTLIVDIIMDTESDEPVPTGINKTYNEISTALESGSFVVFRYIYEYEEDGESYYEAYFSPLAQVQSVISESEEHYMVMTGNNGTFASTDPDENMAIYSGSDEGGSSSPSL